jgi:hypothetical protein
VTNPTPTPRDPKRFRLTTGVLMLWVCAVAVGLGVFKGDVADWLSPVALFLLSVVTLPALVLGIPWLGHLAEQSRNPAVRKPLSDREHRAEHMITVSLLGLITAALLVFGVLAYTAIVPGR